MKRSPMPPRKSPMTRSQKLASAGFTRRPTWKSLPSDDDVSKNSQKVDTSPERVRGVDIDRVHFGRYGSNEVNAPAPKTEYVRSAALMSAYRLIPCQVCGRDDGTVAGAHSNWATHGKGRSIKASDDRCASLCYSCHHGLDQGPKLSEAERKLSWFIAHRLTVAKLVDLDLWPRGILVPDISRNPFTEGAP